MPKIVDHGRVRAAIIERAGRLFIERGYTRIGMREVAAAARIPKSTLYHYFATKEALFAEVSATWLHEEVRQIEATTRGLASPSARIRAALGWLVAHERELLAGTVVMLEASTGRGAAQMWQSHRAYVNAVARLLGISVSQTRKLLVTLIGAVVLRQIDGGQLDLKEVGKWLTATKNG